MIKQMTNAAIEAQSVTLETLPLARYSPIINKDGPNKIAINRKKNLRLVNSFGFSRFVSGDFLIVLYLIIFFPEIMRQSCPQRF